MQFFSVSAEANKRIEEYANENGLSVRLYHSLIYTYQVVLKFVRSNGKTEYRIRQSRIARELKFSREWTNKLIRHLEKSGVLVKDKPAKSEVKIWYDNIFKYILPYQVSLNKMLELIRKKRDKGDNKDKGDSSRDKWNDSKKYSDYDNSMNNNHVSGYNSNSKFNGFSQRQYSKDEFEDIENKLLGWKDD